jgi:hypothetical protein
VKKGRHRRFEEARALKRSSDINIEDLFESLQSERSSSDTDDPPEWGDVDDAPEWDDDED